MLWTLLIIGISLFLNCLRKAQIKDLIMVFLLTSYLSAFLGVLVVEENMLEYSVNLLSYYFSSSILYEYLLLPVVNMYFYQATHSLKYPSIVLKCAVYTSILTVIEVILERNTDLISYHSWTWIHTLTVFLYS